MTPDMADPSMWTALVSPATEIFLDTLNWQNAMLYLWRETALRVCCPIAAVVAAVTCLTLLWRKNMAREVKVMLTVAMLFFGYVGSTKFASILGKSSSDEGSTLVEVMAGETNGYSCVIAKATGLDPSPMWYRMAASNDWTLATDDGWTAVSADHSGDLYTREWRNADTNAEVTAWNMWYFGENPPAVELTVTGGVNLVGAVFSGRLVKFTWQIDADVPLREGSRLIIQNYDYSDSVPVWQEIVADESPTTNLTETAIYGFWLDRKTAWRLRLEVPQ